MGNAESIIFNSPEGPSTFPGIIPTSVRPLNGLCSKVRLNPHSGRPQNINQLVPAMPRIDEGAEVLLNLRGGKNPGTRTVLFFSSHSLPLQPQERWASLLTGGSYSLHTRAVATRLHLTVRRVRETLWASRAARSTIVVVTPTPVATVRRRSNCWQSQIFSCRVAIG